MDMSDIHVYWPSHLKAGVSANLTDRIIIGKRIKNRKHDYIVLRLIETFKDEISQCIPLVSTLTDGDIFVLGALSNTKEISFYFESESPVTIVEFHAPSSYNMQFYSLRPVNLLSCSDFDPISSKEKFVEDSSNYDCENYKLFKELYYKTHTKHRYDEQATLDELNCFDHHVAEFSKTYPNYSVPLPKRSFKVPTRLKTYWKTLMSYVAIAIRLTCELWFQVCQVIPFAKFTATGLQINLRCRQLCYFPMQYLSIGKRKSSLLPSTQVQSLYYSYLDYIRVYNTVWLIINDVSFGISLSSLLFLNADKIATHASGYLELFFIFQLKELTAFLNSAPFGIKLNDELSGFLKELFIWIIDFCNDLYITKMITANFLRGLIRAVGVSSYFFGATFGLSIFIDYLSLLSLHLKFFYRISSRMYAWQLNIMRSLFYLFYGKKKNVLRHRVDNEEFPLDVLLMGILFFVILVFLLPTVFAFYITYSLLQYFVVFIEILSESVVMLLNHFPLFVLMLRFKDPKRVPGGIIYDTPDSKSKDSICALKLKNIPLNFDQIFESFHQVMGELRFNYLSINTLKKLFTGRDITVNRHELYATLYLSIPSEVISVGNLLNLLKTRSSNNN